MPTESPLKQLAAAIEKSKRLAAKTIKIQERIAVLANAVKGRTPVRKPPKK